jgi:hypothetical protein
MTTPVQDAAKPRQFLRTLFVFVLAFALIAGGFAAVVVGAQSVERSWSTTTEGYSGSSGCGSVEGITSAGPMMYAGFPSDSGLTLYRSTDGGSTWETLPFVSITGPTYGYWYSMSMSAEGQDIVVGLASGEMTCMADFAQESSSSLGSGNEVEVLSSQNGGMTWTTSVFNANSSVYYSGSEVQVAVNGASEAVAEVSSYYYSNASTWVAVSTDNGISWGHPQNLDLTTSDPYFASFGLTSYGKGFLDLMGETGAYPDVLTTAGPWNETFVLTHTLNQLALDDVVLGNATTGAFMFTGSSLVPISGNSTTIVQLSDPMDYHPYSALVQDPNGELHLVVASSDTSPEVRCWSFAPGADQAGTSCDVTITNEYAEYAPYMSGIAAYGSGWVAEEIQGDCYGGGAVPVTEPYSECPTPALLLLKYPAPTPWLGYVELITGTVAMVAGIGLIVVRFVRHWRELARQAQKIPVPK